MRLLNGLRRGEPEELVFAVFHVARKQDRAAIQKKGLISRIQRPKMRSPSRDKADEDLGKLLSISREVSVIEDSGKITQRHMVLSDFVLCHFIKPLNRWYILSSDVYRWQQEGKPLDVWVVQRDYVLRAPHVVCLGHWESSYWGGPIYFQSLDVLLRYIERPSRVAKAISSRWPSLDTFLRRDIPNILRGAVNTAWLGQRGNRYRHLLHSMVLIHGNVTADAMKRVDLAALSDLVEDEEYTFSCKVRNQR